MSDLTPRSIRSVARSAPLLSEDAEISLGWRMKQGREAKLKLDEIPVLPDRTSLVKAVVDGLQARDELVEAHLRIAISMSRRYLHGSVEIDDLYSAGFWALISAAELFPERARGRFSAYARGRVQMAISRTSLQARFPLQVPDRLATRSRQLDYLLRDLEIAGEVVTVNYLSEVMCVGTDEIQELLGLLRPYLLLSTPLGTAYDLSDTLFIRSETDMAAAQAEIDVATSELRDLLAKALDKRAMTIVCLRHGIVGPSESAVRSDGLTFAQIGEQVHLSAEGARNIYNRSIIRLSNEPGLAAYREMVEPKHRSVEPDEIGSWFAG